MLMSVLNHQRGVGLVEILVALMILAIGVLGFVALQYRALEASAESTSRVQAISIARDLAERIRVNRNAFAVYQEEIQTASKQKTFQTDCVATACTDSDLADFDVSQVANRAASLGMTMNIMDCQNTNNRSCIYVAWGDSSATDGAGTGDCTNGNAYNPTSTCVIMETY
ncbi:type IV pilus modification protein PilV [Acinetobacter haemolyticus]|nr:type IV pilus modification protein PilV [Acinetobacter sp. ATCC 27244]NAR88785.1 type IV pilus modification protein PilV [Acinetobacter haemolyticus]NAR94337.1 type IV pilus modification protein PilV [Acinetobacter haemolyticus]NAS05305.1 type IV pilus modification protein PilV [Acinetobacter haemolyticus]QDJ91120.1 type IV pilus modification protein PilV [Acinetobacter haemolyticus]